MSENRPALPRKPSAGQWVQTERAVHEAWASLINKAPKAAQLMHILTARIGERNAVIISQKTLRTLMGCSRPTVERALDVLAQDRWIEVRQVGESRTVNAYFINDRAACAERQSIAHLNLQHRSLDCGHGYLAEISGRRQ